MRKASILSIFHLLKDNFLQFNMNFILYKDRIIGVYQQFLPQQLLLLGIKSVTLALILLVRSHALTIHLLPICIIRKGVHYCFIVHLQHPQMSTAIHCDLAYYLSPQSNRCIPIIII